MLQQLSRRQRVSAPFSIARCQRDGTRGTVEPVKLENADTAVGGNVPIEKAFLAFSILPDRDMDGHAAQPLC
jgi:hypothetical protein